MPSPKQKMANYEHAYGTILIWDDLEAIAKFKDEAPGIYKDKCEEWATQSNGMHQYHLWSALEAFGLGANLQHYNPLIDERVQKTRNLPKGWALRAQMVFGTPLAGATLPDKVQKLPIGERFNAFGAAVDGKIENSM
jgi:predicted oxidoreductase (fatty acid repression mutant protein)